MKHKSINIIWTFDGRKITIYRQKYNLGSIREKANVTTLNKLKTKKAKTYITTICNAYKTYKKIYANYLYMYLLAYIDTKTTYNSYKS